MVVMREILNVKQTQVHPGDPSEGWKWKAFLDDSLNSGPKNLSWRSVAVFQH
jgi:hypothetical protein